jgi:hypothetical protein
MRKIEAASTAVLRDFQSYHSTVEYMLQFLLQFPWFAPEIRDKHKRVCDQSNDLRSSCTIKKAPQYQVEVNQFIEDQLYRYGKCDAACNT